MIYLELFAVVILSLGASGNSGEKTPLYFSYITTKTFAAGAIPVVDLALEQINNRTDILPNYTLNYTIIGDAQVHVCLTIKIFYNK